MVLLVNVIYINQSEENEEVMKVATISEIFKLQICVYIYIVWNAVGLGAYQKKYIRICLGVSDEKWWYEVLGSWIFQDGLRTGDIGFEEKKGQNLMIFERILLVVNKSIWFTRAWVRLFWLSMTNSSIMKLFYANNNAKLGRVFIYVRSS